MEIKDEKQWDMVLIAPVLTKVDEAITRLGEDAGFLLLLAETGLWLLRGCFFIVVIERGVR